MVAPVVTLDFWGFWEWVLYSVFVPLVLLLLYFGTTKRRLGKLGKAELGNKSGIIGVICPPDGNAGVERLKVHYTGILYSLAKKPSFGRIFFSGRNATIHPIGASRVAFIEARSGLAVPPEVLAIAQALNRSRFSRQKRDVPRCDSIEQLVLTWAETRYFPTLAYQPMVRQLSPAERLTLSQKDPTAFQQWSAESIADQTRALSFEIDRINNLQVLNEIKTGVIRKITSIEKLEVDRAKLLVTPKIREEIAQTKLRDDEKHDWFIKMTQLAANDPEKWPIEIGGSEGDIREIFRWNLSTFGSGDVSSLHAVDTELSKMDESRSFIKFVGMGIFVLLSCLGVVVVISQLHL